MVARDLLRIRTVLVSLVGVQFLTACQTIEYGPQAGSTRATYAYSEQQTGEGKYILKMEALAGAKPERVHMMWERRARELCGDAFQKTLFRAERPTVAYQNYGGMPGNMILEGFLICSAIASSQKLRN